MKRKGSAKGFTLIELTVVIIIMAAVASLVAPLTIKEIGKSRARTEFMTMRNIVKGYTTKAFAQGTRYRLELDGNSMKVTSALESITYRYEYMQLPKLSFYINRNGFPTVDNFTVQVGVQQRQITMEDMLGVKQDLIYAKH